MSKKVLSVYMETEAIAAIAKVAEGAHLDGTKYAAMVLGKFSDLRPEHALDAIAAIPKDFFRRGPGRPTAATSGSQIERHVATDHGR